MRLSTALIYDRGLFGITNASQQVNKTQNQLSLGTKVLTPADDPVAAARILAVNQEVAINEQYEKNIVNAENRLGLEESVLTGVTDLIIRAQELTLQANNAAMSDEDMEILSTEVAAIMGDMVNIMNTKDANGEYIFSGFLGDQIPFVETSDGYFGYAGDDGQRFVNIASSTQVSISDPGSFVFEDLDSAQNTFFVEANEVNRSDPPMTIKSNFVTDQEAYDAVYPEDFIIEFTSATTFQVTQKSDGRVVLPNVAYASGEEVAFNGVSITLAGQPAVGDSFIVGSSESQSLLTSMGRIAEELSDFDGTNESRENLQVFLADSITNLDTALSRISEVRSELGARLNTLDTTQSTLEQISVINSQVLSDLQDLDYAEAASRLSFQSFVLESAQQSYVTVTSLNLFSFL